MRILLLDESGFPEKYDEIEIRPGTLTKKEYSERKILDAINDANPHVSLEKIIYADISHYFPNSFTGKYSGLIIEERIISPEQRNGFETSDSVVFERDDNLIAWMIFAYVFLSPTKEDSRDILVPQAIYPELLQYMEKYLHSPSFTIANHPIYFLNIINKHITAKMPIKHFSSLKLMGIEYIGVFDNFACDLNVPNTLNAYLDKFYRESVYFDGTDKICETKYFTVNITNRLFKVNISQFTVGDGLVLTNEGYLNFHGSDEKFYLMDMLPSAMMAIREGYALDISSFNEFCGNTGTPHFKDNSKKLKRFRTVNAYLNKLIDCRR